MAWIGSPNNFAATGTDPVGLLLHVIKNLLVSAGWSVVGSGDGIATWQNQGDTAGPYDVLSVSPSGLAFNSLVAGSISNTEAWVRLRHPTGTLEIQFKRSNSAFQGHLLVVAVDPLGFTNTGIANANTPPTGTKTSFLLNSTSWTSYQSFSGSTTEDNRCHAMATNTSDNGIFSFWGLITKSGSGEVRGGIHFTALLDTSDSDPQPWVFGAAALNTFNLSGFGIDNSAASSPISIYDYGGGGEIKVYSPGLLYGGSGANTLFPGFCASAPDGKARHLPVVHGSRASGTYKGVNAHFRWKSIAARNYPDTYDLASGNPRIVVSDLVLPWLTGITPA